MKSANNKRQHTKSIYLTFFSLVRLVSGKWRNRNMRWRERAEEKKSHGKYVCIFGSCTHYYFARRRWLCMTPPVCVCDARRTYECQSTRMNLSRRRAHVMEYHKLSYRTFKYNFNLSRRYMPSRRVPATLPIPLVNFVLILFFSSAFVWEKDDK